MSLYFINSIRLTLKFRSKSLTSVHIQQQQQQKGTTINHFDSWLAITINSLNASTSIIFKLIFFLLSNLFAFHFSCFWFLFPLLLFISLALFFCVTLNSFASLVQSRTRCCDSLFGRFSLRFFLILFCLQHMYNKYVVLLRFYCCVALFFSFFLLCSPLSS